MRIGIDFRCLADPHIRGFARYTIELATALNRRSDCEVIGFSDSALSLRPDGVRVVYYGGLREISCEQYLLPRLLRRNRIDIYVCPANRGLPLFGPPSVLVLHDAVEWHKELVPRRRIDRSSARFIYSTILSVAAATRIVTVSTFSAADIEVTLRLPSHRIRVIHEAPGTFTDTRPSGQPLGAAVLPSEPYLLYFGGTDAKKDIPTLLRGYAASRVVGEARLVIAGLSDSSMEPVLRLSDELGISSRLDVLGYLPDAELRRVIEGACCFVTASLGEGFGLPAAEAMALGTPVIAAAAGASPEIVASGGRFFPPRDWRALATVLGSATDPAVQEVWGCRAMERASDFSWDRTAEAFAERCAEVVERPTRLCTKLGRVVVLVCRWPRLGRV